ncbi:helix-turn-helix transcriptional regulator [Dictyobacter aurantiacus]|uniref:Transcriptional regulator n=1 Tax=Dictyobacter aurantiacus TaxID=1936993 RepID=A0A401ZIY0_9CHLR|nr:winged helix-turn-helix domain-containing protein [Dictyobacter aurantiacus]GCE06800.1 transcriptional regulator [Dictyobacter aurantiacus]
MRPRWTFLTNHAQVFLCVTQNPHLTAREISAIVGITERAVQRILSDLEEDGYVQAFREGRNNRYTTDLDMPLRHPAQHGQRVGDLLEQIMEETSDNNYS